MHGGAIFLAFFVLFSVASYAVPVPLFPGSLVPLFGFINVPAAYVPLASAVVNGIVYGLVVWLVFLLVSRRLEEPKVTDIKQKPSQRNSRRR
jgi:hypothetical protein